MKILTKQEHKKHHGLSIIGNIKRKKCTTQDWKRIKVKVFDKLKSEQNECDRGEKVG